ncbi:MAG: SDR family NAD(P)-dependent oxidoreductase [Alphaproteobacteria bacterium]
MSEMTYSTNLSGKVALVTGSTKGIGLAMAEAFAEAGAKLVISSRKQDECDEVAASFVSRGWSAVGIAANIGRVEDLEKLVAESVSAFGGVDILACNAAVNPAYGPLSKILDEAWHKIFQANVFGAHKLAQLCAPKMVERGGGSIIMLASIAGLIGSRNIGAYGVSKAANAALARNLAVEWGRKNIRVNAIAPGLVVTKFAQALWDDEERAKKVVGATPLGRLGEPADIAGMALFLASGLSRFVTGQTLVVDGGMTMNDLLA